MATLLFGSATLAFAGVHQKMTIVEVTALITEASTADEPSELQDRESGDTNFPFVGNMKAIATVGEVDKMTGKALTGYPDDRLPGYKTMTLCKSHISPNLMQRWANKPMDGK